MTPTTHDEEVAKELKEKLEKNEVSPEDVFAGMHQLYAPLVLNTLARFSKKQLTAIVKAILQLPPDQKMVDRMDELQKTTYHTMDRVLLAKYMMVSKVLQDKELERLTKLKENQGEVPSESEPKLDSGDNGGTPPVSDG